MWGIFLHGKHTESQSLYIRAHFTFGCDVIFEKYRRKMRFWRFFFENRTHSRVICSFEPAHGRIRKLQKWGFWLRKHCLGCTKSYGVSANVFHWFSLFLVSFFMFLMRMTIFQLEIKTEAVFFRGLDITWRACCFASSSKMLFPTHRFEHFRRTRADFCPDSIGRTDSDSIGENIMVAKSIFRR